MTETINYEERVAKGIALLDERYPGWFEDIDLDELNVSSASSCVTAQLADAYEDTPDYEAGMNMLDLDLGVHNDGSYTQHGFNAESARAPGMPEGYSVLPAFVTLNYIWHREIVARRARAAEARA